jgi:hypothetical protein
MYILVSNINIILKYVEYVIVVLIPVAQVIYQWWVLFVHGNEHINAIKPHENVSVLSFQKLFCLT